MSYEYYQQVIIAQEYFPSFNAMAITNHSKYTTSTLAVLSALAFKPSQAFGLTGCAQQGDKPTQDLSPF